MTARKATPKPKVGITINPRKAQHQSRFERAAQTMCGGPGSFELLPDNAIQCLSRMGQVTVTAKVAL